MDEIDKKIIKILQKNARTQFNDIARLVGLSNAAVHMRIVKLERSGIIEGYSLNLNSDALGKEIHAIMKVTVNHIVDKPEQTLRHLLTIHGVTQVYTITGEWDYFIFMDVSDMKELKKITTSIIKEALPHLVRTDTSIIMDKKIKPIDI